MVESYGFTLHPYSWAMKHLNASQGILRTLIPVVKLCVDLWQASDTSHRRHDPSCKFQTPMVHDTIIIIATISPRLTHAFHKAFKRGSCLFKQEWPYSYAGANSLWPVPPAWARAS